MVQCCSSRNFVLSGLLRNLNLKNLNKKRTRKYQVIDQKKKKKHEILQFPSYFSNFELLHNISLCLFIAYVGSIEHFILLSLSNVFILMQLSLSICYCFYKKIF